MKYSAAGENETPGDVRLPLRQFSIAGRLVAIVIACQLLLTVGLTFISVVYFRSQFMAAFDSTLLSRATSTLALVRYSESVPPGLLFDSSLLPPASDPAHADLFEIRVAGRIIARSDAPQGLPPAIADTNAPYADFTLAGTPYRAVALRDVAVLDDEESVTVPARVTVTYAAPLADTYRHLTNLGISVAATSLLLLCVASALAFWGVHRGLVPLRQLAQQAGAISVRNWDFRPLPEAASATELAPLTGAIETVLSRLKESFRQQRDFTSDAAHELKTCLAILKSTVQSLLQRPRSEEEYRAGLDSMLEDCGRLEDLIERMLRLARIDQWAEAGPPRDMASTELTSTCEAAIARMQSVAASHGVEIELSGARPIHLRADPEDLELVWVNLIDNAVRYSPSGSSVVLRIHPKNGSGKACVSVEDSGPGISPEELPRIFERFHRGDPSRARSTGGFGLGLAICKALVIAYGGVISAQNRPGRGAELRVDLPCEPLVEV
jgi:signal transduction histidine kinase